MRRAAALKRVALRDSFDLFDSVVMGLDNNSKERMSKNKVSPSTKSNNPKTTE